MTKLANEIREMCIENGIPLENIIWLIQHLWRYELNPLPKLIPTEGDIVLFEWQGKWGKQETERLTFQAHIDMRKHYVSLYSRWDDDGFEQVKCLDLDREKGWIHFIGVIEGISYCGCMGEDE